MRGGALTPLPRLVTRATQVSVALGKRVLAKYMAVKKKTAWSQVVEVRGPRRQFMGAWLQAVSYARSSGQVRAIGEP